MVESFGLHLPQTFFAIVACHTAAILNRASMTFLREHEQVSGVCQNIPESMHGSLWLLCTTWKCCMEHAGSYSHRSLSLNRETPVPTMLPGCWYSVMGQSDCSFYASDVPHCLIACVKESKQVCPLGWLPNSQAQGPMWRARDLRILYVCV